MFRGALLTLLLLFPPWVSARANDAVDYSTYPTLYEQELPNSASVSAVQLNDFLVTLHNKLITVWDFSDFSYPMRRGELRVDSDAEQLIQHRGECYLISNFYNYIRDGLIDTAGHLDWIDLSNPDLPARTQVYDTGYIGEATSWGDDLIYNTYGQTCDVPPIDNCWFAYHGSKILHFSSATQVTIADAGDRYDQDFMGSGLWFWILRGDLLTAYPSTDSGAAGVRRGVPLGSRLISVKGDLAWARTSASTFECFRASPDTVISVRRYTSEVASGISRVVPWQSGALALGGFGVQIFGSDASSSPIWRVAQSPNFALVQNNRAWVISELTGGQEILLDPPVETPPRIGLIREEYSRLNMSADGRFLFAKVDGLFDSWDLESTGGPQRTSRTYLGSTPTINSISIQDNRVALVYPDEVQLYRFDTTSGVPSYETSFSTQIGAVAGAFANEAFVVLSQEDGLEIHGTGQGTPLLSHYDSEDFTSLQQLHVEGTMVWFLSGTGSTTELIGVSIAQPQAPQAVARIPLGTTVRWLSIDRGTVLVLRGDGTCHALSFGEGEGADDLGEIFPGSVFELVLLQDGILYTVVAADIRVWRWNGGAPELLGLQEGPATYSVNGVVVRGGSLALLTSDPHEGHILRVYPAQLPDVKVPVLLESFEVYPTGTRRHLVWRLATSLPVSSMKLVVVDGGFEKDLALQSTSRFHYGAWDELRTHEVTYRLLEKQTGGSWIILHEEQVAGSTLSWIGPKVLQNPALGSLDVAFAQPRSGSVTIDVIDLAGRRVARLQSGVLPSGLHNFQWDGRDASGRAVARGVYFLRSQSGGHVSSTKFTLVR